MRDRRGGMGGGKQCVYTCWVQHFHFQRMFLIVDMIFLPTTRPFVGILATVLGLCY